MDIAFHYPPELLQLLTDTIPLLCRSKVDVLLFFRGAGVPEVYTRDLSGRIKTDRDSITKFEIVRTVLARLNEKGEAALRERREVLKRVVEFEDFSTCWPDDQLKAKGLVSEIRHVINVKDSFTRMSQEREKEHEKHRQEYEDRLKRAQERAKAFEDLSNKFASLFAMRNPQERGLLLEKVLNDLFSLGGILIRESFKRTGESSQGVLEQIDGVVEMDGEVYLVEMKWLAEPVGLPDVSQHLVRIYHRGSSRGIFISASGYTEPALQVSREALQKTVVVLCTLEEFVHLLEQSGDPAEFFKTKVRAAIVDKNPYKKIPVQ